MFCRRHRTIHSYNHWRYPIRRRRNYCSGYRHCHRYYWIRYCLCSKHTGQCTSRSPRETLLPFSFVLILSFCKNIKCANRSRRTKMQTPTLQIQWPSCFSCSINSLATLLSPSLRSNSAFLWYYSLLFIIGIEKPEILHSL